MRRFLPALFLLVALASAGVAHAQLGSTGVPLPSSCVGLQTNSSGVLVCQTGIPVTTQSGTTYTFVLADEATMVESTSGSATTFTVPTNASVAYPIGTTIAVQQGGAGKLTIAAAGGVTLNFLGTLTASMLGQYGTGQLIKTGTDTWTLFGAIGG